MMMQIPGTRARNDRCPPDGSLAAREMNHVRMVRLATDCCWTSLCLSNSSSQKPPGQPVLWYWGGEGERMRMRKQDLGHITRHGGSSNQKTGA